MRHVRLPTVHLDATLAVVAATVIGSAARVATIGMQSFWDDEVFTVGLMRLGFVDMLKTVPQTEGSPHVYYVLAWLWTRIFGTGEWGLRSLSALIGTATIPIAYLATHTVGSKRAAAIAAVLVATNPFLVWYSQEARAYALLAFLGTLSFYAFGRALRRSPRGLLWWTLTASLALATHYFALFIVIPEAAWLLYSLDIRRRTVGAMSAVGTVCLALAPLAAAQSNQAGGLLGTSLLTRVAQVPVQFLVGYGVTAVAVGRAALVVSVLLIGFAGWLLIARSSAEIRRGAALAASIAALGVMIPIVGALVSVDFVKTLYFISSVPLFTIAAAVGFAMTRGGLIAALVVAAIGAALTAYVAVTPWLQREDIRGVASALGPPKLKRAIVLAPVTRIDAYMRGLQGFPMRGMRVREVDFVAMPVKSAGGVPDVPRKLARAFQAPGFKLWRPVFAERFTILRFRAPSPHRVTPAELLGVSFRQWPLNKTSILVQSAANR